MVTAPLDCDDERVGDSICAGAGNELTRREGESVCARDISMSTSSSCHAALTPVRNTESAGGKGVDGAEEGNEEGD